IALTNSSHTLNESIVEFDSDLDLDNQDDQVQDKAAKFLLKVKEENRLGQTTMQKITGAASKFFRGTLQMLKRKLTDSLENEFNVESTDISGFEEAFEEIDDPFEGLNTAWQQKEYFKNHLSFVVSEQVIAIN
ncbi:hypothetical protein QZH41_018751, partial [Actinostola sp. cb2023]